MVFKHGFFHADPHPGNFFVEPSGQIGLIDFGEVGTLDERTQQHLAALLLAITRQDSERLVDAFLELGVVRQDLHRDVLRRDLEHVLARYYGKPLGEIAVGPLLGEVLGVVRRHHLQLPATLALLLKTAVMDEGLGVRLDPSFQLTSVLAPYAQQLLLRQYSPLVWARRFGESSLDALQLGADLPPMLRRLMGELERGGLKVSMSPSSFEPLVRRFERLANRLILGILAAAFVNGLAVLLSVYRPPGWEQWAGTVLTGGSLIAGLLGVYLTWTILRCGR
jgi:ubiquinone biosynthesis protein